MKMIDIFIFAINAVTPIIIMIRLGYYLNILGTTGRLLFAPQWL